MARFLKLLVKKILNFFGYAIIKRNGRIQADPFFSHYYQRNTRRRLEHLAGLGLDIAHSSVLEVGAGIGDCTDFFIDRACRVVTSDAREEIVNMLRMKYPDIKVLKLDLDNSPKDFNDTFDIVYCYGVLYHLNNPAGALRFLSHCCRRMLLLSTVVSYGSDSNVTPVKEDPKLVLHSVSGKGCRPTRRWVFNELKKYFEYVYLPITQPNHAEFPIDWSSPCNEPLPKTVYIASREKIDNKLLTEELPIRQMRH